MALDVLRLMTDFGLLVLIWVVQLIIYPGFAYYSMAHFARWHTRYMQLITFLVAPLMFLQAGIVGFQVYTRGHLLDWGSLILIVLVWALTFFGAVPLHQGLGPKDGHQERVLKLVRVNWYRTLIWTVLWLISGSAVYQQLF